MPLRADRVQRLQREKGLTNRYIATVIDVNENTVSRWVSGKRQPGKLSLNQLAALFEVSMEYLLGITDNPEPPPDLLEDISEEERQMLMAYRRGGKKAVRRLWGDDEE